VQISNPIPVFYPFFRVFHAREERRISILLRPAKSEGGFLPACRIQCLTGFLKHCRFQSSGKKGRKEERSEG
jgi:hypothetical protein